MIIQFKSVQPTVLCAAARPLIPFILLLQLPPTSIHQFKMASSSDATKLFRLQQRSAGLSERLRRMRDAKKSADKIAPVLQNFLAVNGKILALEKQGIKKNGVTAPISTKQAAAPKKMRAATPEVLQNVKARAARLATRLASMRSKAEDGANNAQRIMKLENARCHLLNKAATLEAELMPKFTSTPNKKAPPAQQNKKEEQTQKKAVAVVVAGSSEALPDVLHAKLALLQAKFAKLKSKVVQAKTDKNDNFEQQKKKKQQQRLNALKLKSAEVAESMKIISTQLLAAAAQTTASLKKKNNKNNKNNKQKNTKPQKEENVATTAESETADWMLVPTISVADGCALELELPETFKMCAKEKKSTQQQAEQHLKHLTRRLKQAKARLAKKRGSGKNARVDILRLETMIQTAKKEKA